MVIFYPHNVFIIRWKAQPNFVSKNNVAKEYKVTKKDTVYLPSPTLDDTIDVILPLEEKVYEDSTFRAVISGFKPSLKELTIYPTTTTITEKKLIRTQEKGFKLRPSIGIGYGLTNRKPDLFLGISLTYNF